MADQTNAATELAREHAEIDCLAARIDELEPGRERTALVGELAERFFAHADAEERLLYPALRHFVPGGWSEVADQGRRQHAVARTIRAIERLPEQSGDEYDVLVSHLVVGVQDHVRRQDAVLLPKLIDACPIEDINRLGRQLNRAVELALAEPPQRNSVSPAEPEPQAPRHGFWARLRRFLIGPPRID
ncbi:hemerythrin domain-containing protein [Actinospica sp. MGRD01-02]|uniref:Hemerythrin domain-containing protein n=1 Tax=Actinospica acidithermotolerans TaxID=2828514 RepID=A0A941ECN4_9ACTN|nr:hemerythrin domain-containing protein [Actinospica acidithermotolerans]MBR7828018.1 hemerythrin domain-containing protein [Actinospica acidithermotolerans]